MLTTAIPSVFFPEDAQHFSPDDLATMRRAFCRACDEHPEETATEAQRDALAKAIFSRYLRGLSERDLVTAAFWTLHGPSKNAIADGSLRTMALPHAYLAARLPGLQPAQSESLLPSQSCTER